MTSWIIRGAVVSLAALTMLSAAAVQARPVGEKAVWDVVSAPKPLCRPDRHCGEGC